MYAQLLDRRQQRLHLILLAPATFCGLDPNNDEEFDIDMNDYSVGGQCPTEVKVIYEDKSDIWLNVSRGQERVGMTNKFHHVKLYLFCGWF